jgi:RND family efflux transporter MFP subunit
MRRFHLRVIVLTSLFVLQATSIDVYARDFDAVLSWAETHVVNFPLDGGIKQVHVRPGQRVRKGAKLVELDREPIAIRVRQYEAEVAARKPVLSDARRAFEQAQSLYEQTVLSDDELQRAQHAYDKASAELAASRARLDYARWQQKKAEMLAPWDAWIVQRNADPGQMLVAEQRSKPLLVLAKTGVMGATAVLPLTAIDSIKIGQTATVMIGEEIFPASVSSLAMQGDPQSGTVRYRLEVAFELAADDEFRAGQPATIRLP